MDLPDAADTVGEEDNHYCSPVEFPFEGHPVMEEVRRDDIQVVVGSSAAEVLLVPTASHPDGDTDGE